MVRILEDRIKNRIEEPKKNNGRNELSNARPNPETSWPSYRSNDGVNDIDRKLELGSILFVGAIAAGSMAYAGYVVLQYINNVNN